MSPMVTITRDLDNLIKESGADKINLAYSTAEYDESFENIKFGLIASSMQKPSTMVAASRTVNSPD